MAGIWGVLAPKIGTTNIDYVQYANIELYPDNITFTSDITKREFIVLAGEKMRIEFIVHLYKYANPASAWSSLAGMSGTKKSPVYLHRDGTAIRDWGDTADAEFLVESVTPFYINTKDYLEGVRIRLRSLEYVYIKVAP